MNKNVGESLRKSREAQALSIEQASQATHIRGRYIEALEAGDFGVLPSHVQVRGFLRSYASYLGLDPDELMVALRQPQSAAADMAAHTIDNPPAELSEVEQEIARGKLQAEAIFSEIAQTLQQRRDMLSLTLEEVERHTHIPPHYIQFLENGQFDSFPSPVQARGMLGNYAKFLDMDSRAVLLRYADALQVRLAARQNAAPRPTSLRAQRKATLPPQLRALISADLVFIGVFIVALVVFLIWGGSRILASQSSRQAEPTAPSISSVLLPSQVPPPTLFPTASPPFPIPGGETLNTTVTVAVTAPPFNPAGVRILIEVRLRAWIRVTVDNQVVFEGRVAPGESYAYSGNQQIELLASSGSAIYITLNEQALGPLGIFGQVVNVVYTSQGVVVPTATITPTPTVTPPVTPTATFTPTPPPGDLNIAP